MKSPKMMPPPARAGKPGKAPMGMGKAGPLTKGLAKPAAKSVKTDRGVFGMK